MANYKIADYDVSSNDEGFKALLGEVYTRNRDPRFENDQIVPLCKCKEPGLPMYIAKVGDLYVIKRMPNSGGEHASDCDSYELPADLSGLADVYGTAIKPNGEEGTTSLKFDFSLSKSGGPGVTRGAKGEPSSVRTDGSRLTLRGAFHYLYAEAGLNHWDPAFAGKRNWAVVYNRLTQAAKGKESKGKPLLDNLYIIEPFFPDQKNEINSRRNERIRRLMPTSSKAPYNLMIFICEVRAVEESSIRKGGALTAKQLPEDFPFLMDESIYKRMTKRFGADMKLVAAFEKKFHLLAVGTFGVDYNGNINIDEISLMAVNENWIPVENAWEKELIDKLTEEGRQFDKSLRYNRSSDEPLPSVIIYDTYPRTAMYVVPSQLAEKPPYMSALQAIFERNKEGMAFWAPWLPGKDDMPEIPPRSTR